MSPHNGVLFRRSTFVLIFFITAASPFAREHGSAVRGDVDPKTRMTFPPRAGAFAREGGIGYDNAGYPEATYAAGRVAFASVFYYKNLPFAAEYANCRDAVTMKTPSARLISDGASNLHSGGRRAVFAFEDVFLGGPKTKLMSELLMFPHRDYYLTFRVTYLASHADRARQDIDTLVRAFKL
jgi:hypothetical protein